MTQVGPHCLRVIATIILLVPAALKFTKGQNLTVLTSHDVSGIIDCKVNIWMTDSQLLKYQSSMLEGSITKLKARGNLNLATFLPEKKSETPYHAHSQFLTLNVNFIVQKDLMDIPLDNYDM